MKTKQRLAVVTKRAARRARVVGKMAAKRLLAAADAALVAQGKAARARQRKRAVRAALKKVAKTAAIAGAVATTIVAARARIRATQEIRDTSA